MNPVDGDGNVTRCRICVSKFHWHQDCTVNLKGLDKISLFQAKDIESEETRIFFWRNSLLCFSGLRMFPNSMRKELVKMLPREP